MKHRQRSTERCRVKKVVGAEVVSVFLLLTFFNKNHSCISVVVWQV